MQSDGIKRWEMEVVNKAEPQVNHQLASDGCWCMFEDVERLVDAYIHTARQRDRNCSQLEHENRRVQEYHTAASKLLAHDIEVVLGKSDRLALQTSRDRLLAFVRRIDFDD